VFSAAYAVLVKALPYPDAERLVLLSGTHPEVSRHPVLGLAEKQRAFSELLLLPRLPIN
jgi:hypothetical protein